METQVWVYIDLEGTPLPVGRLWARVRKGRETTTFECDARWLRNPSRFSLEPALMLAPGPFHTPADLPLFGAIGDSAPDRWGRVLMRRVERRRAERLGETPRTLREIDYLLRVDDEVRQGGPEIFPLGGRSVSGGTGRDEDPAPDRTAPPAFRRRTRRLRC